MLPKQLAELLAPLSCWSPEQAGGRAPKHHPKQRPGVCWLPGGEWDHENGVGRWSQPWRWVLSCLPCIKPPLLWTRSQGPARNLRGGDFTLHRGSSVFQSQLPCRVSCKSWCPGGCSGTVGVSVPCTLVVPGTCGSALLLVFIAARSRVEEGDSGCKEEPEPVRAPSCRAGAAAPASCRSCPPSPAVAGGHHGGDGDLGAAHSDAEQGERGPGWLRDGMGSVGLALPDTSLPVPARTLSGALASLFPEAGTIPTG